MKKLLVVALVVAGLAATSAGAGVDSPPTKDELVVGFQGLNSTCPGFTTPESFRADFADLVEQVRIMSVVKDGVDAQGTPIGIMTTTLQGHATDAAGVRFKIDASFRITTPFMLEGGGWFFPFTGAFGTGPVEITRKDGAAVVGDAEFILRPSTGPLVRNFNGTCVAPRN